MANSVGGGTVISGPQLSDAIASVGLSMTKSEVEILSSGKKLTQISNFGSLCRGNRLCK